MIRPTLRALGALVFLIAAHSADLCWGANQTSDSTTKSNWLVAIGTNEFIDPAVSTLRYCKADAESIHSFFAGSGFVPSSQAYLVVSGSKETSRRPTRNNILKTVTYVAQNAGPDSTIIVSFSGHGFGDEKSNESYLFPEDGKLALLKDTALSVNRLNQILAGSKATKKILLVDACRSTSRADLRGSDLATLDQFFKSLKSTQGQITMAACGPGQVSYEMPDKGQGVFTHFLLEGLKGAADADKNGLITLSSLQAYVASSVPEWCRKNTKAIQQPWMWGEMTAPIPLSVKATAPAESDSRPPREIGEMVQTNRSYVEDYRGIKLEMIWIPGGTATVGSPESDGVRGTYDQPTHTVKVEGFWIGKYEITEKQYAPFFQEAFRETRKKWGQPAVTADVQVPNSLKPATELDWDELKSFCAILSAATGKRYRAPTEAQWEYACRAGTTSKYFFGDESSQLPRYANVGVTSGQIDTPDDVGKRKPNPWGLYDMYGNVSEWCYATPESSPNPSEPDDEEIWVMRGGNFYATPEQCTSYYRDPNSRRRPLKSYGFRIVRVP